MKRTNKKRVALGIAAGTGLMIPLTAALVLFLLHDKAPGNGGSDDYDSTPASPFASSPAPQATDNSIMLDAGTTLMLAQGEDTGSFAVLGAERTPADAARSDIQSGGSPAHAAPRAQRSRSARAGRSVSRASGAPYGAMASTAGGGGRGSTGLSASGVSGSGSKGTAGSTGAQGASGASGEPGVSGDSSPNGNTPSSTTPDAPSDNEIAQGTTPVDPVNTPNTDGRDETTGAPENSGSPTTPHDETAHGTAPGNGGDHGGPPKTGEGAETAEDPASPPADDPNGSGAPADQPPVALGPSIPLDGDIVDPLDFPPELFAPVAAQAAQTVPEPGALGLVFAALVGLGMTRRASRRKM